ncbi:hypothetical protein ACFSY7_17940 [Kurthia populi]|uniref:Phage tail assembly protein n=1 Tax=Kurthia populi TaxID=1562132 RepID=A0ABW5Y5A8_9BACL|nr:hypothetical protein [Candidatus Kurthia intestinigallinarum]
MTKIKIGKESVRFEANALFPVKYKQLTKRDIFKDLKVVENMQHAKSFEDLNIDILYDIVYVLAWFADRTIPERDEWLLQFDEFDVFEVMPQVVNLLVDSLNAGAKKNKPVKQGKKNKK